MEVMRKVRKNLQETLDRKDYLITVHQVGDEMMSMGDIDKQVLTKRYYQEVSLSELGKILEKINAGFWTHPDLKEDLSNHKKIPFEEKKWGIISNIIVQPLSEKLESRYLELSKNDFFKRHRMVYDFRLEGNRLIKIKKN